MWWAFKVWATMGQINKGITLELLGIISAFSFVLMKGIIARTMRMIRQARILNGINGIIKNN